MRPAMIGLMAGLVIGGGVIAWITWESQAPASLEPTPEAAGAKRRGRDPSLPAPPTRRKNRAPKYRLDNTPADPPKALVDRVAPTPIDAPPSGAATVSVPQDKPNVVVVLGCTVRKDQLSPYGGSASVTPHLDSMAKGGTVFDDTIAAAPWTRAASTAILTGRHAVGLGLVEPGPKRNDRKLPDAAVLLSERMSDLGYLTLGATANPNLIAGFGFDQGFDQYQVGLKVNWAQIIHGDTIVRSLSTALGEARAQGDNRPAYLQMMMIDAHGPRTALEPEFAPYKLPDEPDRMAQYRSHLHTLDAAIALLETKLNKLGLNDDNTVFIFAADHGEGMNFPGHHGYAHGQYMTSSTNHVAWIMKGAGVAKGHRILGPTSQVDLVPTLMGVIGYPSVDENLEGTDLSALVRGEGHVSPNTHVISDTWFGESSRAAIYTHETECQKDFGSKARQMEKGKFVPGCYDRHADPLYTKPFDNDPLAHTLTEWRKDRTDRLDKMDVKVMEVDPALNRQLIELGYRE